MSPMVITVPGSSPLTRGKHRRFSRADQHRGLIPAHAGKTASPPRRFSACPAHPRSRGENEEIKKRYDAGEGSSPLTRGKLRAHVEGISAGGLIPAHAGKTYWSSDRSRPARAHPRSRGENLPSSSAHTHSAGSSPLTRGKPRSATICLSYRGLIPAHAGKTLTRPPRSRTRRAHPRSRGENPEYTSVLSRIGGSSPLTRGKPG